ncbi:hypothetical protein [Pseudogracilibacillus sp. SO30301A]|uniref:hypothetical protein n=1 Tax=Pseudogracilibacillus sp. SO30301A TaxID=3098291 RepID=UPI00300DC897
MVYNESRRFNKNLNYIKKAEKVKMKLDCEIKAHKLGKGKDGTVPQLKKYIKI